jgi:hypothetical protein
VGYAAVSHVRSIAQGNRGVKLKKPMTETRTEHEHVWHFVGEQGDERRLTYHCNCGFLVETTEPGVSMKEIRGVTVYYAYCRRAAPDATISFVIGSGGSPTMRAGDGYSESVVA